MGMAAMLAAGISAGAALRVTRVGAPLRIPGPLHAATHTVLFGVLTLLLLGCTRSPRVRWLLCLGAFLLGCGTEYYEGLCDGYGIENADVFADALGIAAGAVMMLAVAVRSRFALRSRRSSPRVGRALRP